jgi:hypothetical protein
MDEVQCIPLLKEQKRENLCMLYSGFELRPRPLLNFGPDLFALTPTLGSPRSATFFTHSS